MPSKCSQLTKNPAIELLVRIRIWQFQLIWCVWLLTVRTEMVSFKDVMQLVRLNTAQNTMDYFMFSKDVYGTVSKYIFIKCNMNIRY